MARLVTFLIRHVYKVMNQIWNTISHQSCSWSSWFHPWQFLELLVKSKKWKWPCAKRIINVNPMSFVMTNLWVVEWRVVLGKLFRPNIEYILILIHFRECKVKQPKSSLVEGKVCRFDGHCEEGEYCERYITPFIGHCTSKLSDANLPQCYCKYLSDCGNFGCGTWCDTATKMCTVWPWKKWLYKTSWK